MPPIKWQRTCRTSQKHLLVRSDIWFHFYSHYASNNMSNPNYLLCRKSGNQQFFQENLHIPIQWTGFIRTIELYWKGEFGSAGIYLNYFCPSLKCICNIKPRTSLLFYKKTNTIYFKSLCSLTFKYLTSRIKKSLLLALLTMQILWKEEILTETTFTKSSSDNVSNISMTDVRINFNVNPLTLPLLNKVQNRKVEFSKYYVKHKKETESTHQNSWQLTH